jgi:uroporphyrinogen-III synthase
MTMGSPIVVHTGPADRADRWTAAIRAPGFELRVLPAIEIQNLCPTDAELKEVAARGPFVIVVVTSARAAWSLRDFGSWIEGAQLAVVGAATAEACRREGFEPRWIGAGGRRPFLESLAGHVDFKDATVLFPRGDLVDDHGLPELAGLGARVVAPPVYRTVAVSHPPAEVKAALAGAAGVTLTSPSGVRSFSDAADAAGVGKEARRLFAATLGPMTEAAARKAGFSWRGVSRRPSPAALADLLRVALNR